MEKLPERPMDVPMARFASKFTLIIYRESARLGEWSEHEVRRLLLEGLLFPADFFWREGMAEWERLESLFQRRSKRGVFL